MIGICCASLFVMNLFPALCDACTGLETFHPYGVLAVCRWLLAFGVYGFIEIVVLCGDGFCGVVFDVFLSFFDEGFS